MDSPETAVVVTVANSGELAELVPLFACYRVFYGYADDPEQAAEFLRARFEQRDSRIFLARIDGEPVGFAQCYPGHSSLACRPSWLLSDLYVARSWRGQGAARALLEAVRISAGQAGCCLVELFTARDNQAARSLYQAQGYVEDQTFLHYELML